jgi:hypothetical protein
MVENGSLKLYQNRPGPEQGECCLKKGEKKCLTFFWYSPTKVARGQAQINPKDQNTKFQISDSSVELSNGIISRGPGNENR